jgi:hypothetical protein
VAQADVGDVQRAVLDPDVGAAVLGGHVGPVRVGVPALDDERRAGVALLELLLYAGPRVRSAGDLALSLRGEAYPEGSLVRDSDRHVVIAAMAGLMEKLGEHGTRWIEAVDDTYRLAPSS